MESIGNCVCLRTIHHLPTLSESRERKRFSLRQLWCNEQSHGARQCTGHCRSRRGDSRFRSGKKIPLCTSRGADRLGHSKGTDDRWVRSYWLAASSDKNHRQHNRFRRNAKGVKHGRPSFPPLFMGNFRYYRFGTSMNNSTLVVL